MVNRSHLPRAGAHRCPASKATSTGVKHALTVVRSGDVWEVRDADGVVSWATSREEALAEAVRHRRAR
jgi:hypothetical protein